MQHDSNNMRPSVRDQMTDNTPTPGYIRGLQEGLELTQRHTVQVFLLGSISGAGLYHALLAAIALVGAA